MSTAMVLKNVILSYPHLITPWAGVQGNYPPAYSAAFIIPKDWQQWPEMQACVSEAIQNKWGAKVPQNLKLPWLTKLLQPAVIGPGKPYEGCYTINASDKQRKPKLYDAQVKEMPDMVATQELWGGCIVNAYVNFYAYTTDTGGVGTGLVMVQLVDNKSVTPLGGEIASAEEVFKPVAGAPPPLAPVSSPWD